MQRLEPVEPRHPLRRRPVAYAIHGDRQVHDAAMAMEAAAHAEDGSCPADRQGFRQSAIEGHVEPGSVDRVDVPAGGRSPNERYAIKRLAMVRGVSSQPDSQAAGSGWTSGAPKHRPTEESFRAGQLRSGTDREIRAVRPRPGAESMRAAYLELLKLCLCDLAGARTLSVSRTGETRRPDSQVKCWELNQDELALRAKGSDWPLSGLTMVGLKRLDDFQACVESVVADGVEGDVIEAGSWRGGASILARATLDSLGADERTVWVADSFRGLPAPESEAFPEDHELDSEPGRLPRRPGRGGPRALRPLRVRAGGGVCGRPLRRDPAGPP